MILRLDAAECSQALRDYCDNELVQGAVKVTRCYFEPETSECSLTFVFEFSFAEET